MKYEYKTTTGEIAYDDPAVYVESVDDPYPPDGEGWELVSSAVGGVRYSKQPLFWFWKRPVPET